MRSSGHHNANLAMDNPPLTLDPQVTQAFPSWSPRVSSCIMWIMGQLLQLLMLVWLFRPNQNMFKYILISCLLCATCIFVPLPHSTPRPPRAQQVSRIARPATTGASAWRAGWRPTAARRIGSAATRQPCRCWALWRRWQVRRIRRMERGLVATSA